MKSPQELATLGKGLKLRAERQPGLSSERRAEMNRVADNVMVAAKVRACRAWGRFRVRRPTRPSTATITSAWLIRASAPGR